MAEEALYQLEIKLPSGENGESRTQVINLKGAAQIWYSLRELFPERGNDELLYVATDEKRIYFWNDEEGYVAVEIDLSDVVGRIEALEKAKEEYDNHIHEFVPEGVIKEDVVMEVEAVVEEIEAVETLPQWDNMYTEDTQTLSFSWLAGATQTKQVATGVSVNKAKPTFEGIKGVSNIPGAK